MDSSGPEVKIRGSATQLVDKYQTLAREANLSGDRIAYENYLQHAEHYFRLTISASAGNQPRHDNLSGQRRSGGPNRDNGQFRDGASAGQQAQVQGNAAPAPASGEASGEAENVTRPEAVAVAPAADSAAAVVPPGPDLAESGAEPRRGKSAKPAAAEANEGTKRRRQSESTGDGADGEATTAKPEPTTA